MQSVPTPIVPVGGTQEPLVNASQLRAGAYLTGIDMTHVWQVLGVESGADGKLTIQKLPAVPPAPGHRCNFVAAGRGTACSCGIRKQAVKEFLPLKVEKPRVHVIMPSDLVHAPKDKVVYGNLVNGALQVVTFKRDGWSQLLPILPELTEIWAPPTELEALLGRDEGADDGILDAADARF